MDKMEFEEFVSYVRDNIADYLMPHDIDRIDITRVNKNNGLMLTGLNVRLVNENISPSIYLESFYSDYENGRDIEEVLQDISNAYSDSREMMLQEGFGSVLDKIHESRLYLRTVNYNRNRSMLEGTVYERYMDMALQVRVLFRNDDNGTASSALTYELLDRLDIGRTEAFRAAKENTPNLFPVRCDSLTDIISGIYELMDEEEASMPSIYVLTNEQKTNGAVYVAYEDIIADELERKGIKGDAYIIPSSIHELLLIPVDRRMNEDYISEMVREVNSTAVSQEEFLSDNIYRFNARDKTITQITDVHREQNRNRDIEMER